jgi:3-deoxy-D-manno-octulosonic-acid transferase
MIPYLIYNFVLTLTLLLTLPFAPVLLLAGARYRTGLMQRLSYYQPTLRRVFAGQRRPIWIHAASVGEVRSVKDLVQELKQRFPDCRIILSTFTDTGNRVAKEFRSVDLVLFLPLDLLWVVRRALAIFDPAIMIFIETEIWPNVLWQAHRRGIPTVLLSGRISDKAFVKYNRFKWLFGQLMRRLKICGMQSKVDRERIIRLGAAPESVIVTGSLKQSSPWRQEIESKSHESSAGDRLLWVIGSSHRGEEEIVLRVFQLLKQKFGELRVVLAPRHPQRFFEVERLLISKGLSFEKKSKMNGALRFQKDILLLDTIGDLEKFYAIGDVAFVGGSLIDAGGHNLLEPARLHRPVLFGPYTANVSPVANALKERGGGFEVRGAEDLATELLRLLEQPRLRQIAGENAYRVALSDGSVVESSLALIERYLLPVG